MADVKLEQVVGDTTDAAWDGAAAAASLIAIAKKQAVATGADTYLVDALTAKASVKAAAGNLYGWHVVNSGTADAWLHFYDALVGSVTVGTTGRKLSWFIPAGGILDAQAGQPIAFGTGITIAPTTTLAGSTAPLTGLTVDLYFK